MRMIALVVERQHAVAGGLAYGAQPWPAAIPFNFPRIAFQQLRNACRIRTWAIAVTFRPRPLARMTVGMAVDALLAKVLDQQNVLTACARLLQRCDVGQIDTWVRGRFAACDALRLIPSYSAMISVVKSRKREVLQAFRARFHTNPPQGVFGVDWASACVGTQNLTSGSYPLPNRRTSLACSHPGSKPKRGEHGYARCSHGLSGFFELAGRALSGNYRLI